MPIPFYVFFILSSSFYNKKGNKFEVNQNFRFLCLKLFNYEIA